MYSFKQLINYPTRITCNTSTLIDYILTNTHDNISQPGAINNAISDHNIFCTSKIVKAKYHKHTELNFRSLRNYSVGFNKQTLERNSFPNYENFYKPDIAYRDFINRFDDCVVNPIAPFKKFRVKNNKQVV